MARWCGARRHGRNGPSTTVGLGRTTSRLRHSSRIDAVERRPAGRGVTGRAAAIAVVGHDDLDRRARAPAALVTRERGADPVRPAPASRPARGGRRGRVAGSKPLPSSSIRSRTPPPAASDVDADLPGGGVLDDVVERLLGDPVEHLLDGQRQALRRGRSRRRSAGRSGPGARRVWVLSARTRPSCSRLPGPQLEDQRPHLGQGLALEVAQLDRAARAPRPGRGPSSISIERVTRVMENSAWVTESCSSRARWARSSPAASSPAWRRSSRSRRTLVADVAGRAVDPGELAVDVDHADAR